MRQRVTDIRIHYSTLDWVKSEIDRYHDAIDEVEISMLELEDLLHEQESEAIIRLLDEVESVKITMGRKKAALQDASVVIGDYVAQMSALVALTNSQEMMRVDHNHVNRRIRNMRGVVNRTLTEHHHNVLFTPTSSVPWRIDSDERERIRQLMQRNFTRLDNFRTGTLRVALQRALDLIQQIADIRTSKLIPFQDLDREFRDRAHEYYRTHIDSRTRRRNWWIQLGGVAEAFLRAFAIAFVIAFTIALLPKIAIAGVIVALAIGVAIMVNVPEERVPDWLSGVRDVADGVANLARDTMRYGPQVLVDAVVDGVVDQVQTNEGIASLSGSVIGGFAGTWAGTKVKAQIQAARAARGVGDPAAGDINFMEANDQFRANASRRLDVDVNGSIDIIAHGTPDGIQMTINGKTTLVDHRTASRVIANNPAFNGQSIRLLSCSTGAKKGGFAQNLSNRLNVEVIAPNDLLWAYPNGRMVIAPRSVINPGLPDLSNIGRFVRFRPGG